LLYAFDLIELNGDDLRRDPLEVRKATLASVIAKAGPGLRLNGHIEADGPTVFAHACKMGLEGIVSKRKASPYRSGRSPDWLKSHSGRRTFVTRAARLVHKVGGSLRDVQLLAGHRSIQTTKRYIDGDSDAQRQLVSLI
jgi:ATP-dependent DNA ligase